MGLRRLFAALIFVTLILGPFSPALDAHAQAPTPPAAVKTLLNSMSPEERVGQLFLVTFTGIDTGPDSQIYDLIVHHHIGGVILLASNDNFTAAPQTVSDAYRLIDNLQRLEWESATAPEFDPAAGGETQHAYLPLFIGISQEGNGYPTDQLLSGLTALPDEMAVGATWEPDLANQVGAVLGKELSALGVNLYLGPSLDVLESPNPSASGDLGTRVFGGDPYWVGEMGQAYINGLHMGSQKRLLVIAKHFPGSGGSDRLPEEEVATVRKSLEQLKQIELAPFFAVTGGASSPESVTDGLLVSHIRYQGFQGNIRATTRPVSFDVQALADILSLPQFASWRENGGLIVSDDLGSWAVRQFYAPGGQQFSARLAARDAFLAGNDLLYLGGITSSDSPDTYSATLRILDFFAQKYREDPAFAQQVDAAVTRILNQKYRLYGSFNIARVAVLSEGLSQVGKSQEVTFAVARRAATLVSPDRQDFATILPSPPQIRDRLVFITDTVPVKQCNACPEQPALAVDALQQVILRLYGPESGNQTSSFRLSSYSLDDLKNLLEANAPPFFETDLSRAGWIILSFTDASRGQPELISRFLSERQDLLREKRVILFSFGAPYYLDATDISKLTAYFALYSKQPPFVELAARLLFQELIPLGASPVSIPGLGYDLISVMAPDPNQVIPLFLDLPPVAVPTNPATPLPTPIPFFKIGDTIALRTGVIHDHNGNPVPDGTVVRFSMVLTGEGGGILQQVEAVTARGIAHASFGLDKPGLLEIHAVSEPATVSEALKLDVTGGQPAAVTVVIPVLTQTVFPTPAVSNPQRRDGFVTADGSPRFSAWLLTVLLLGGITFLVYWTGSRLHSSRWGVRWGLCALLGGLGVYNYLALGLPGGAAFVSTAGMTGILGVTLFGELMGWGVGWLWLQRIESPKPDKHNSPQI